MKKVPVLRADEAMARIRSGQHVLVGTGAGEPQHLVEALTVRGEKLADVEVIHLMTLGEAPYAEPGYTGGLRHNALFIGPNVRAAVGKGLADYTPCFLSQIPALIRDGRLAVDVALVQVSTPREGLYCLGISVDILKAAVEKASYVVAQVNPRVPWTSGDSCIRAEQIDAVVEFEEPLLALPAPKMTPAAISIGRYVARLVRDGDTLQFGIGAIPDAVASSLGEKKDLGVHSEMISDGVLRLLKQGVITGERKTLHQGRIVTSFCMGSQDLYSAVNDDQVFAFFPSDYVNDPSVIARNDRMVSINSALQVDLTGQVCADSIGKRFYSGVGGQVDFIRGASLSRQGRSIIALPSTAKGGEVSRISPLLSLGAGVVTTRAEVDFIVTEFGIASLKGKTIRERALALIQISHPKFRTSLFKEAKELGYIGPDHVVPKEGRPYRLDLEARRTFKGTEVFFRPIKLSDERRLKDLFYSQSEETTYRRFGMALKRLSEKQFQELVAIDYHQTMAIAGFVRDQGRERMIAVARYYREEDGRYAEAAFTVHDRFQGRGIGTFLVDYLAKIARGEGLVGFRAQVLADNTAMMRTFRKAFTKPEERYSSGCYYLTLPFSKMKGNRTLRSPISGRPAGTVRL